MEPYDSKENQSTDQQVSNTDADEKKLIIGIVTNCLKLNLREKPMPDPNNVIMVISALTEVAIDLDESTDDYYKVCTATGIEGFCMRKFIAIRK